MVITGLLTLTLALIVFGPVLPSVDQAWGEGDLLSTYVNSNLWNVFSYAQTTTYGYPLGMDLTIVPTGDITQNLMAQIFNTVFGTTFAGINLVLVLSFPITAMLAYATIRLVGLSGPLAIALATAYSLIPYHFGRGFGHLYLATMYAGVTGIALAIIIGSGRMQRWLTAPGKQRTGYIAILIALVIITAWSGVYYAVFAMIIGGAAWLWRIAQRDSLKDLGYAALPLIGLAFGTALALAPGVLHSPLFAPFAPLAERLPYESVQFAGVLAMAILPAPTMAFGFMQPYNTAVLEAVGAAPALENTTLPNFGSLVTTAALLAFVIGIVIWRRSRKATPKSATRNAALIGYLIAVVVLFFVPWGLNYLFAGTISPQIRAWNRLLPQLLLLFVLGGAAVLATTRWKRKWTWSLPIALVIVAASLVESVLPFRAPYQQGVTRNGEITEQARAYAMVINERIPQDCGVLQLPYVVYPEQGPLPPDLNDYEHFWQPLVNPEKSWTYGAIKFSAASQWAAQLPQIPTPEQTQQLIAGGFCGIHLDRRGFRDENWADINAELTAQLGAPITGKEGDWAFYTIDPNVTADPDNATQAPANALFLTPRFAPDDQTVAPRGSRLDTSWWWTIAPQATIDVIEQSADVPITGLSGAVRSAPCGPAPVTVELTDSQTGEVLDKADIEALPRKDSDFDFTLTEPRTQVTLTITTAAEGCVVEAFPFPQFTQVIDLAVR